MLTECGEQYVSVLVVSERASASGDGYNEELLLDQSAG